MIAVNFRPGDIVRVFQRGYKPFEGTVIAIKGNASKSFTVRKLIDKIAVERIWPVDSPLLEKIEKVKGPKKRIRRAKLYYLRKINA